jgi:CBS domain-containing protein
MDVLLTGLEQGTTIVFENGSQHETMVPERITCEFDASPFILMAHTNIERVRYLFGILSLSSALVVDHGKLVGIVHKRDLLRLVC